MVKKHISQEDNMNLLCNALYVAGEEMGKNGDHWPVIKSTIHSIRKVENDLATETDISDAIKLQYEHTLEQLEKILPTCTPGIRPIIERAQMEIRETYAASFSPVDKYDLYIDREKHPPFIERARHILKTLGGDDEKSV